MPIIANPDHLAYGKVQYHHQYSTINNIITNFNKGYYSCMAWVPVLESIDSTHFFLEETCTKLRSSQGRTVAHFIILTF